MTGRSYLSIGDVLSLLRQEFPDVTISKIRFLESQGLVNPERSPSGYRKFYDHDVERLRWVLRQQREHFLPLKVIRDRLANGEDLTADSGTDFDPSELDPGDFDPAELDAAELNGTAVVRAAVDMAAVDMAAVEMAAVEMAAVEMAAVEVVTVEVVTTEVVATEVVRSETVMAQAAPAAGRPMASDPGVAVSGPVPAPAMAALPGLVRAGGRAPAREKGSAPDPARTASTATGPRSSAAPSERPAGGPKATATPVKPPVPESTGPAAPPGPDPAPGPTEGSGGAGSQLTLDELCTATGLSVIDVAALEGFGLVAPNTVAGVVYYDEEARAVAHLAAEFARYGIEPRHLRLYRNAVDREVGLVEQIITPLLRQRNPEARQRAVDTAADLGRLGQSLRAVLLRTEIRRQVGP